MGAIVETAEGEGGGDLDDVEHLRDLASEAPVIRLVNLVIQRAVELRASDIHIEPFENRLKVRYRIDGVLEEGESPPANLTAAVIIAHQDHGQAQHRRAPPAAGRPHHAARAGQGARPARQHRADRARRERGDAPARSRDASCSISTRSASPTSSCRSSSKVLEQPHGILLVTGPTGSGKTTTLYTALSKLNTPDVKIITVEDPVEYQIEGINQIQAKPQIGLDFAHALRSIVRQDPDIIMIGEMRDLETARIAIQSALTGHLVLSTLHTNNAAGGITRLLDMGVEDYLLTSTINGILAQRLVRRLEPTHAERYPASPEEIEKFGLRRYQPQGDDLPVPPARFGARADRLPRPHHDHGIPGDERRTAPRGDAPRRHGRDSNSCARQAGMRTMYEDGIVKAMQGDDDDRGSAARDAGRLSRMPLYPLQGLNAAARLLDGQMEAASDAEVIARAAGAGASAGRGQARRANARRRRSGAGCSSPSRSRARGWCSSPSSWRRCSARASRWIARCSILLELPEDEARQDARSPTCATPCAAAASLSAALERQHGTFSRLYINMVRAGEAGGSLHETLARLADYLERTRALRGRVVNALIYPAILLAMVAAAPAVPARLRGAAVRADVREPGRRTAAVHASSCWASGCSCATGGRCCWWFRRGRAGGSTQAPRPGVQARASTRWLLRRKLVGAAGARSSKPRGWRARWALWCATACRC